MKRTPQAFTIVELVMAIGITSLIATVVMTAAFAADSAYVSGENYSQYVQTASSSCLRLQSELRKSRLVVAQSASTIVVWAQDANSDGQIQVSELSLIRYDPSAKTLYEQKAVFPPALALLLDLVVPLSTAVNVSLVDTLLNVTNAAYCQKTVLADNVRSLSLAVDQAPPMTHLVKFAIQVGDAHRSATFSSSALLRADKTAYVGLTGGLWTLSLTKLSS